MQHMPRLRLTATSSVLALLIAGLAWATTASVSGGQPSGQQGQGPYTFSYNVTVSDYHQGDPTFRDLHIYPRGGVELNFDSVQMPPGWKKKKAGNGGIAFIAPGNGETSGTFNFALVGNVSGDEVVNGQLCDVVVTSSGKATRQQDDAITSVPRNGPTSVKSMTGTEPLAETLPDTWGGVYAIHVGQTAPFTVRFWNSSMQYRVYDSVTAVADWSDTLELGIDSNDPVPQAWGLVFAGSQGTLANGEATFSVTVPNDPQLIGKTFYAIGTLQEGGQIAGKTYDIAIRIVE